MRFATFAAVGAMTALFVSGAQAETVLTVATAGSENMAEYVTEYLGPKFEAANPGVKVRVLGTGPGDAGSNAIMERLEAQMKAGAAADIDVAVVHQKPVGHMVEAGLLTKYVDRTDTGKLVTSPAAKNALGVDVSGYVIPMFHSQTAWAYNPDLVPNPPQSYAELQAWVKEHPKAFGYNGIRNGMSGISFVTGWMYSETGQAAKMMEGPYDPALVESAEWNQALAKLKDFNQYVAFTPGNAGTLDMLNRGEIAIGPVWVDMFYTWQADGRLNPSVKLELPAPGMPGQPMYYVVPAKTANTDLAVKFIELATSPAVQAEGIVERFNWYPGIDPNHLKGHIAEETWNKLFAEITPEDLAANGKTFPLVDYFNAILTSYEKNVE